MPDIPQIDKSEDLSIPIEKTQIVNPKIIYAKGHCLPILFHYRLIKVSLMVDYNHFWQ